MEQAVERQKVTQRQNYVEGEGISNNKKRVERGQENQQKQKMNKNKQDNNKRKNMKKKVRNQARTVSSRYS